MSRLLDLGLRMMNTRDENESMRDLLALLTEEICDPGRTVYPHLRNSWGFCTGKPDKGCRQIQLSIAAQKAAADWLEDRERPDGADSAPGAPHG